MSDSRSAIIVGVGMPDGLGATLARRFAQEGYAVGIAGRSPDRLDEIALSISEAGGTVKAIATDATDEDDVAALFRTVEADLGPVHFACYNAGARVRGGILELTAADMETVWRSGTLGGFLVGREAARHMLAREAGTIIFTGATASVKAYAGSAAFAMGKFGLRAIAQSMAREMGPKGIHVAHVIIDGGIDSARVREMFGERLQNAPEDALLKADDIAETYWRIHNQPRNAWTFELDVRPWVESF